MLFEHGFKLENTLNEPCITRITLFTECVDDQTNHFTNAFVPENVAYGYDVVTFESLQPTPFCLDKFSVRKGQFNVLAAFSVQIVLE